MYEKKIKQDRGTVSDWSGTADRLSMETLSDEMTFKQRSKETEGVSHVCVWERVLRAEVVQSEKYLREKLAWHIQKRVKRTVCLEHSEQGGKRWETKSEKQAYELII